MIPLTNCLELGRFFLFLEFERTWMILSKQTIVIQRITKSHFFLSLQRYKNYFPKMRKIDFFISALTYIV